MSIIKIKSGDASLLPDAPSGFKFVVNDGELKQKELDVVSGFKGGLPYKVISGTYFKTGNAHSTGNVTVDIKINTIGDFNLNKIQNSGDKGIPTTNDCFFNKTGAFISDKTVCFIQNYLYEFQPELSRVSDDAVSIRTYTPDSINNPGWPQAYSFEIRVYD